MILDNDLVPVLQSSAEGEMIMAGQILKGLSDEEIAWVVVESVESEGKDRITLHAYWHNVFMVSKIVQVDIETGALTWGVTKA